MAVDANGPLAGVTVIELAHIMAGPASGMLLADLGADVIKVEKVPGGDDSRTFATVEIEVLISLVGRSAALEILLEGRVFGAGEAKEMGLVSRVVADADVEKEALAAARRIADGAPLVARWHKKFARRLAEPGPLTAEELDEGYACYGTEDFETGYKAFLAKTKPDFKGR